MGTLRVPVCFLAMVWKLLNPLDTFTTFVFMFDDVTHWLVRRGQTAVKRLLAPDPLITSGDKSDDKAVFGLSRSPRARERPLLYGTPERCTDVNVVINASADSGALIALYVEGRSTKSS